MNRLPLSGKCESTFSAGSYVADEIDARGWTITDLASASGIDGSVLRALIDETAAVTPAIASGLARAFGTSETVWLNLDVAFRNAA